MNSSTLGELHQWLEGEIECAIRKSAAIYQQEGKDIAFYHALIRFEMKHLLCQTLAKTGDKQAKDYSDQFDRIEKNAFGE